MQILNMVKHIVMFRLDADERTKKELAERFKTAIEALPGRIDGLVSAEIGINDGPAQGNWNIVLTSVCRDYPALAAYANHPDHLACVAIIKPVLAGRACVDYTVK